MKPPKAKTIVILLTAILSAVTLTSVALLYLKGRQYNKNVAVPYKNSQVTDILYAMNYFQLYEIPEFVITDKNGDKHIASKIIHEFSFVLFLSNDFCPSCIEQLMNAYDNIRNRIPIFIVFENISIRELNFRSEVFENAMCYSTETWPFAKEHLNQILLYVGDNSCILGNLIPFDGMNSSLYEIFFNKASLHYENL